MSALDLLIKSLMSSLSTLLAPSVSSARSILFSRVMNPAERSSASRRSDKMVFTGMKIRGSSVFLAGSRSFTRVCEGELPETFGIAEVRFVAADFPRDGEVFADPVYRRDGAKMTPSARPTITAPEMIANCDSLINAWYSIQNRCGRQHEKSATGTNPVAD
jgi:hypothetical protein